MSGSDHTSALDQHAKQTYTYTLASYEILIYAVSLATAREFQVPILPLTYPLNMVARNNNRLHSLRSSAGTEVCKLQQRKSTRTITCQCAAGERSERVSFILKEVQSGACI